MGNLTDSLQKRIKSLGIERQVEAADVVEAAINEARKHIAEDDFKVISFNKGTLLVSCRNSAVAGEVFLMGPKLKKQIKKIQRVRTTQRWEEDFPPQMTPPARKL